MNPFEWLSLALGSVGFKEWVNRLGLSETDSFFFKQSCRVIWHTLKEHRFQPDVYQCLTSIPRLEHLYSHGMFLGIPESRWKFDGAYSLETLLWLEKHFLIVTYKCGWFVIRENILDCIDYALKNNWIGQYDISSVKSVDALKLFLKHGFSIQPYDDNFLYRNHEILAFLLYHGPKDYEYNANVIKSMLKKHEFDPPMVQFLMRQLEITDCDGFPLEVARFIPYEDCECSKPERHEWNNKRVKLSI